MKLLKNEFFKKLIPFAEVFSKIIAFVNILMMMKLLPMSQYADYSYISAIVIWAAFLMDGGISYLVYNKSLKDDLTNINNLFFTRVLISILIIIGLLVYFMIRKPELATLALILSLILFLNSSSNFVKMISRGKSYSEVDLSTVITEQFLRLLFVIILYFYFPKANWTLLIFLSIYFLAGLISFTINFYLINKYLNIFINIFNFRKYYSIIIKSLNESKYFLLSGLFHTINSRIEIIFLEKYSSKNNLALFSSALTINEVILLFFFSIAMTHFKKIYEYKKFAFLITFFISLTIIIVTQYTSSIVYSVFFPTEYHGSALILNRIIVAIFPTIIVFYLLTLFNFENKVHLNVLFLVIPVISKIIIYSFVKSNNIEFYTFVYQIIEYATLFIFVLYFIFRKNYFKLIL